MKAFDAMTLPEQAASRWVEILAARGDAAGAHRWMEELKRGLPEDEGALEDACARLGASSQDLWKALSACVFRGGRRVILPGNPCPKSWAPDRPCTLAAGHEGHCPIADVPIEAQRAAERRYAEEMGAVVAAIGGAGARGGGS